MTGTVKVLLMAANPYEGTAGLRLDREIRGAMEAVRTGPALARLEIHPLLAVQYEDLRRALLEHNPQIVQFSGHGSGKGLFLDTGDVLPAADLAAMFAPHPEVRVVVLNACRTHLVATALSDVVDYTVAMELGIEDAAAVVFSGAFYEALASGRTVPAAFDVARAAVKGRYGAKHALPRLLAREGADTTPILPPVSAPEAEAGYGQANRFRNVNAGSANVSNEERAGAPPGRGQVNEMSGVTVSGSMTVQNKRT